MDTPAVDLYSGLQISLDSEALFTLCSNSYLLLYREQLEIHGGHLE